MYMIFVNVCAYICVYDFYMILFIKIVEVYKSLI